MARSAVGIAVSAVAMWLTLRSHNVAGIREALAQADFRYVAIYALSLVVIHVVRTIRWGLLLAPAGRVSFSRLNAASAVGFMAVLILPFRLGEVARPVLVATPPRLSVSAAASSIVIERILDVAAACLLLVGALAAGGATVSIEILRSAAGALLAGCIVVTVVLGVARRHRGTARAWVHAALTRLWRRTPQRWPQGVHAFLEALYVEPRDLALVTVLTAVYWGLSVTGLILAARAFGLVLTATEGCAAVGVLLIAVMIPAGPGSVGTFQAALLFALSFHDPQATVDSRAVAFANVVWAVQFTGQVAIGLFFLPSNHVSFQRLVGRRTASAEAQMGGRASRPPG